MMTEGEKRWIRKHTEKSLKQLNKIKGVNMKPTKKRPAKRRNSPLVQKLLELKYRINDAYRNRGQVVDDGMNTKDDKTWVMNLISDVRDNNLTKLSKEDMLKCNSMWRSYER